MSIDKELLKLRVKENVKFAYFRDSSLWYQTCDSWIFPVPVSDTLNSQGASATFNAEGKGLMLMRWIRRHMESELAWKAGEHNDSD